MSTRFFDESREQSAVKAAIVAKYFDAWAKVIIGTQKRYPQHDQRVAYIDLFAGPGRYADGSRSTPILVLEKAIADPDLRQRLVTLFNDKDENHTRSLEEALRSLPGIETLKYLPTVRNEEVGTDIVKLFASSKLMPTLMFVDPWGYKGLSLRLVNSVLKDWGCDCIFFFNYNRINAGLSNPMVIEHMNALFGPERADILRKKLAPLDPRTRELTIVEALAEALCASALGQRYVLPFCFKNENGNRTSHHLILVTKDFRGYEIMKQIMAKESSRHEEGVASFEYNPADKSQPILFGLSNPIEDLGDALLQEFAGRTLKMKAIYEQHNIGRPYVERNYKDALLRLEAEGKIRATMHRRNTFGPDVQVTFPNKSNG